MATNVAARLARLSAGLSDLEAVVPTIAGRIVHDAMIDQLRADTGGDQAMSGFAKGRYRMDLKLTPLRNPPGVRITPANKQAGMWTILDSGRGDVPVAARPRRRHKQGSKRGSSRAAAMRVGGAWRAGPWHVGATAGKRTWSKGRDKGFELAVHAVRDAFHEAVTGVR